MRHEVESTASTAYTKANAGEGLIPTPTDDVLPRRMADFATMGEALDYAARSARGLNFHDARGTLAQPYPYAELREDALAHAHRLIASGIRPGDRIALVAETGTHFAAMFFGAIYAGAWPVPLPLPTSFGGRESYIDQLAVQLASSDPKMLLYPAELGSMAGAAAEGGKVEGVTYEDFAERPAPGGPLPQASSDDIAYLQYSSGSTRFPHGVVITHRQLLENLTAHGHGMSIGDGDRCISWLPWYHDMGLVGCLLSPIANQVSTGLSQDRGFRPPPAGLARSYQPQHGYDAQLFAHLRLRHLRAPHRLAVGRCRAFRPVALAARGQRRRHDPPGRDAVVRRCLRAGRVRCQGLHAELRSCRSDARRFADASGRRHRRRTG